jgi:hypothetical protein
MGQEVRTYREGTLRWVQASGRGTGWNTASAPQSGLFGFVEAGANFQPGANEFVRIYNRGTLSHNKLVRNLPVEGAFTVLEGVTGDWPDTRPIATASGATVPMIHLEFKYSYVELGAASGYYYQLMGVAFPEGVRVTENPEGNTREYTFVALTATGPTASGFLS